MEKQLEYLNLEYGEYNKRRTIDDVYICCFNKNPHKHKFHSENTHLNTISDLCYSLLYNFESERSSNFYQFKNFLDLYKKQKTKTEELCEKLDFLKNQQNIDILGNLTTKQDFNLLTQQVDKLNQKYLLQVQQSSQDIKNIQSKIENIQKDLQELKSYIQNM